MKPRIETAEVLSFRLKVPPEEIRRLPQQVRELRLTVDTDEGDFMVSVEDADSYLRFRPIGAEAMLTEIFLNNDERGHFFQNVLGALMVRFGGDLHIRLAWNTPERNAHGDFTEVLIARGVTTYPGLTNLLSASPPTVGSEGQVAVEAEEVETTTPLEKEVRELLAKARADWDEYQRLKRRKE
ncbi:MAG: hypothetical protein ACOZIN_13080 [Myxococcota bacterium]